jgi:hypothetical protein
MIHKFPNLPETDKAAIKRWLEIQKHEFLAQHHSYSACGNISEADKTKHYASCFEFVKMMIDYHSETPHPPQSPENQRLV